MFGVADQALVSGSNFVFNIALARWLGLEGFGAFSLAWMALILVSGLQDALIVYPMMSIGPKQRSDDLPAYFGTIVVHGVVFAALASCLIFGLLRLGVVLGMGPGLSALSLPLGGATFAYLLQNVVRYHFFMRGRPLSAFASDAVSYLGKLIALVALARVTRLDAGLALSITGLTAGLALVVSALLISEIRWDSRVFAAVTTRHWQFGKWLAGSALIRWADNDWYVWMAGGLLGVSAVGALKVAQNLANILQLFFSGLESMVAPQAAGEYGRGGSPALYRYMKGIGRTIGTVAFSLIAGMMIAPAQCLRLLYGEAYAPYGGVLRWFALSQGLAFFLFLFSVITRTLESTRILLVASGLTVLFNVLTSRLMIGQFGLEGAASGVMAGRAVSLAVLLYALMPRKATSQICARDFI